MDIREDIGEAFHLGFTKTEELDVLRIGAYCDSVVDREFEKLPLHASFSEEELDKCNKINKWRQLD